MTTNGFKCFSQLNQEERAFAELLCSGSDERSEQNAEGLNKYGGAAFPRETLSFGSCTNSTITPSGWEVARLALNAFQQRAAEVGELQAADEIGINVKDQLLSLMKLTEIDGLQVVLTPSGTDAESIAVYFAALARQKSLVNILMGLGEVGSGSALAAGAKYFSLRTPTGKATISGAPLDAELADKINVHQIKIRVDSSDERAPQELDLEIKQLVESSLASGSDVVLHIVAHSKTGVHAPRLETMHTLLAEHGERIVPIIDAAQGRFSRRGLRDYLARGFMVILTGSKFYGGPPFSGCLLIPKNLLPENVDTIQFSKGFSEYLTPAQLPKHWTAARQSLTPTINLGLLLRWQVALAEMVAYYDVPGAMRYQILRFFESQAPIILGRSHWLELINPSIPIFDDVFERLLQSKTTVFSFRVKTAENYSQQLAQPELARWVRWINHDISAVLAADAPASIYDAMRTCFQLGQAVHVGEKPTGEADYVIRVAIGGALIIQVANDLSVGTTFQARLAWLAASLERLRVKIEYIATHEADLLACEAMVC
ncbi:hypothetical protein [Methylomonas sp. AM2-LC]|uniref:hypothetical protein n=1 Tax=Methylomonas sp. AM2-LC TaxID=3153301 RepID=UPI00326450CE